MSDCGCNDTANNVRNCSPCGCDPVPQANPTVNGEPYASALQNFTTQFWGDVTVTDNGDGTYTWTLPCDLAVGIDQWPRLPSEGLACWLKRIVTQCIKEVWPILITFPTVKTYIIARNMPYAGIIDNATFATGSGNLNFSIQINGVDITGLTNLNASVVEGTFSPTALNTFAAGSQLSIEVLSTSSGLDFDCSINFRKTPIP